MKTNNKKEKKERVEYKEGEILFKKGNKKKDDAIFVSINLR